MILRSTAWDECIKYYKNFKGFVSVRDRVIHEQNILLEGLRNLEPH
jgi:hypothetical protein